MSSDHLAPNNKPRLRHGLTGSLTHRSWQAMRTRCLNKNYPPYSRYGGAGITICESWNVFENFLADMGERISVDMTLDRVDNTKGYSPENCRWANKTEQGRNKKSNHKLTFNGETLTISAWAQRTGINKNTLLSRIRLGWSHSDTILAGSDGAAYAKKLRPNKIPAAKKVVSKKTIAKEIK